jgi:hypothetical protein
MHIQSDSHFRFGSQKASFYSLFFSEQANRLSILSPYDEILSDAASWRAVNPIALMSHTVPSSP